jgi:hypothetical protein
LDQQYDLILGQLVAMIEKPSDWVVGANRNRDVELRKRRGDTGTRGRGDEEKTRGRGDEEETRRHGDAGMER